MFNTKEVSLEDLARASARDYQLRVNNGDDYTLFDAASRARRMSGFGIQKIQTAAHMVRSQTSLSCDQVAAIELMASRLGGDPDVRRLFIVGKIISEEAKRYIGIPENNMPDIQGVADLIRDRKELDWNKWFKLEFRLSPQIPLSMIFGEYYYIGRLTRALKALNGNPTLQSISVNNNPEDHGYQGIQLGLMLERGRRRHIQVSSFPTAERQDYISGSLLPIPGSYHRLDNTPDSDGFCVEAVRDIVDLIDFIDYTMEGYRSCLLTEGPGGRVVESVINWRGSIISSNPPLAGAGSL